MSHEAGVLIDDRKGIHTVTDRQHSSERKRSIIITAPMAIQISQLMASIAKQYAQTENGNNVLLDTRWKILEDNRLTIKQISPFERA